MLKERELQQIRKVAVETAEEAGKVLMRFYRKRLEVLRANTPIPPGR